MKRLFILLSMMLTVTGLSAMKQHPKYYITAPVERRLCEDDFYRITNNNTPIVVYGASDGENLKLYEGVIYGGSDDSKPLSYLPAIEYMELPAKYEKEFIGVIGDITEDLYVYILYKYFSEYRKAIRKNGLLSYLFRQYERRMDELIREESCICLNSKRKNRR